MANTTATGGYLVPSSTAPAYDVSFEDALQSMVVGIVGLAGNMVRPRWQLSPPKMPENTVNWAAIGVMSAEPHAARAQIEHVPTGDGSDVNTQWEKTTVLASFYGPGAWANAGYMDSGIRVAPNRYALEDAGIAFRETGPRRMVGELVNETWQRRVDIELIFDRIIKRTYPVLNLLSAHGVITANGSSVQETIFDTSDGRHEV